MRLQYHATSGFVWERCAAEISRIAQPYYWIMPFLAVYDPSFLVSRCTYTGSTKCLRALAVYRTE
jgi:hypothetical protein